VLATPDFTSAKTAKKASKEARKQLERASEAEGKLYLLHWHQRNIPAQAGPQEGMAAAELVSTVKDELKRLEKVSKVRRARCRM
jgi:hypothetical protein